MAACVARATPRRLVDFDPADFGLVPARAAVWQGFLFVSLDPDAPDLAASMADLWQHIERFPLADLRRARRIEYDVQRQLEGHRRELFRVLPLSRACIPS